MLRRRDVTGWFDMSEGTVVEQIVHATHRGPWTTPCIWVRRPRRHVIRRPAARAKCRPRTISHTPTTKQARPKATATGIATSATRI
jgi:hypothetical protein